MFGYTLQASESICGNLEQLSWQCKLLFLLYEDSQVVLSHFPQNSCCIRIWENPCWWCKRTWEKRHVTDSPSWPGSSLHHDKVKTGGGWGEALPGLLLTETPISVQIDESHVAASPLPLNACCQVRDDLEKDLEDSGHLGSCGCLAMELFS